MRQVMRRRLGAATVRRALSPCGCAATAGFDSKGCSAGRGKGVQLVIVRGRLAGCLAGAAAVSRAPVEGAVRDRGAAVDRAAAGEAPQDLPGASVQRVHIVAGGGVRSGVDDTVRGAPGPG